MPPRLEFLCFDGCPNTPAMGANVQAALVALRWRDVALTRVDLARLAPGDARLRYGSPTLLADGVDLFGQPPAPNPSLSCRVYPGGVPAPDLIAARLSRK